MSITYLSRPESVSMGDAWFDLASTDHFWIRRRFEVLRRMTEDLDWPRLRVAEIGCGSGLVQRQVEDAFGVSVDGFDLNEQALARSVSQRSRSICYNILSRAPELRATYDVLLLLDVVEHIEDAPGFLAAALYHLTPGGSVIINVPALPALWSAYDTAAGHVRRYMAKSLIELVELCGATTSRWTYWGKPFIRLLRIRQWRASRCGGADAVLRDGIASRGRLVNAALLALSRCERIPQHKRGTSLMLVATR